MHFSEPTASISRNLFRFLYHRIPMSVDANSVRLVCRLGVLEVLQKEYKRIIWWSGHVRRQKRDFFPRIVVSSIRTVCDTFLIVSH
jgi:hypothetical protein